MGADATSITRSFNRYELKYAITHRIAAGLKAELQGRLDTDSHARSGFYPVWNLYYDTTDLRCYWEKVDGLRFRRKLRIRHYGTPGELDAAAPVFVEIKQRINRVTQKRRGRLTYGDALELCAGRGLAQYPEDDTPLLDEVERIVGEWDLRPCAVVGYVREAWNGREGERGLRVTFDNRVRGRDRDLDLAMESENRFIVHPDFSVMEVKVNDRVPYWLTHLVARHNLKLIRMSKYCQCIDAFGGRPRSIFHTSSEPLHEMEPQ